MDEIKRSLRYSILDGAFYSAMIGFGESFISPFAVFLKAGDMVIGLLSSLPSALGSLSQLISHRLLRTFNSRKKMVCLFAFLEAIMYIPIMLVFFFGKLSLLFLIFFVCLYKIFGMVINPIWTSWMGDLVSENERGSYFGVRNRISGLMTFVSFIIAGYIMQKNSNYFGFMTIFTIAMTSRIISFIYLTKKYEPLYKPSKNVAFNFMDVIRSIRFKNYNLFVNYSIFVLYLFFMNFAVFLAAPFFTAYMLYDLHFDYITFTMINAAAIIAKILSMHAWGQISDKYGRKIVLEVSGFLMPAVPLFWIFSRDILYLIIIQFYSGFVWAGFEIASFNFIFDTTTRSNRDICVAYNNLFSGIASILGAFAGGLLLSSGFSRIAFLHSKYYIAFIVSCGLRYIVSMAFLPLIKETRFVEKTTYANLLMKVIGIMPTTGQIHNQIIIKNQKKSNRGIEIIK